LLIRSATLTRIASGEVTLAFRRWHRPSVKAGGSLTTAIGVLAIDAVDEVTERQITADDATRAGYASRKALLDELARRDGAIYRIRLRLAGEDPRIALREKADLNAEELEQVIARLSRMDRASRSGPWTLRTLELIAAHPGVVARSLATKADVERDPFKVNVRKLKNLGLTESLEIGYRISPRGETVLAELRRRP